MHSGARFVLTAADLRHPYQCVLLAALVGCSHSGSTYPQMLADRILTPPEIVAPSATSEERLPQPTAAEGEAHKSGDAGRTAGPSLRGPDALLQPVAHDGASC